jgi:cell division protein FtsA
MPVSELSRTVLGRGLHNSGEVTNLPVRVAGPSELRGLVDQLNSPAFSTSVGLLLWLQNETRAEASPQPQARRRSHRGGPSFDWARVREFLRRLAP